METTQRILMSKLPYGLAPTHLTAEQTYELWNADSPNRYKNLSRLSKTKWDGLAEWINDRATASVDVSERVEEFLDRTREPKFGGDVKATPDSPPNGANIHDADIAAAALRFYEEHGPKKRVDAEGNGEGLVKPDPEKVQTTGVSVAVEPSSADKASALTERLIETLGEVIVLGAKLALQK